MSTLPDNELDLEKLFLPAWAQEAPSSAKYAKYEGEAERPDWREGRRGPRPPRREGPPGGRRDDNRPRGERRGLPGRKAARTAPQAVATGPDSVETSSAKRIRAASAASRRRRCPKSICPWCRTNAGLSPWRARSR